MENVEIAKVLEDYADLLDIRSGKPFKVRSYRQAAKTVAGLSRTVTQIMASDQEKLEELPAIGATSRSLSAEGRGFSEARRIRGRVGERTHQSHRS